MEMLSKLYTFDVRMWQYKMGLELAYHKTHGDCMIGSLCRSPVAGLKKSLLYFSQVVLRSNLFQQLAYMYTGSPCFTALDWEWIFLDGCPETREKITCAL